MRFSKVALLMSVTASTAQAAMLKIGDLAQGSEFTQCIKITDFNTKSLADEVEVTDRVDGCCPEGYIPGIKHYKNYWGAMVICGFKEDGSVALSTKTSNDVKTCAYNKCYVVKMAVTCADKSMMTLDGCCPKGQYTADCLKYVKSASFFKEKVGYCLSYQKKYKLEGTTETTDDQVTVDAKTSLSIANLKAYTVCPGGFTGVGGGTAAADPAPAATADPAPAATADPAPAPAPAASGSGPVVGGKELKCDDATYIKPTMDAFASTFENYKSCDEKTQKYTLDVSGYETELQAGKNGNSNKYGLGMMCEGGNLYYIYTKDTAQATWDALKKSPPDESGVILKCLIKEGSGSSSTAAVSSSAVRAAAGIIGILSAVTMMA